MIKIEDLNELITYLEWLKNPPQPQLPPRNRELWEFVRGNRQKAFVRILEAPRASPEHLKSLQGLSEGTVEYDYRRLDPQYFIAAWKASEAIEKERAPVREKLDHLLMSVKNDI